MIYKFYKQNLAILIIASLFFSCTKNKENNSAESLYINAMKLLKKHQYYDAITEFEKIDNEFPFSKWAIKGQIMTIYANYKNKDCVKVIEISDDFIRLSPNSEYTPYAFYMKGLCYYNKISDIKRSQQDTKEASSTFRELIARYKETEYAKDAYQKLSFIDEHLVGSLMSTARYQMQNNNYIGAIYNLKEVIEIYRNSNQLPEAYYRLIEIYKKIGLKQEANKLNQILEKKFPQNHWTKLAKSI